MDVDRRNWWGHAFDGGLFAGSLAIVNATVLLPSVVQGLHGPEWLVAMMPALMVVGLAVPSIITAHAIGGLSRFRPLLLWTGVLQRVPYLATALVLLFSHSPGWCLIFVALAPIASGFSAGISMAAWQQMLARTVRASRRSSLFAWRSIIGSLIGVGSGWVVHATLTRAPGMRGYGLLHLWTFLGLCMSYFTFMTIREPAAPAPREPETNFWENIRTMPALLFADRPMFRLLMSSLFYGLTGAVVPYLAIHARYVCGAPESFLGELVSWQMAGAIAGGVTAGWVGDRHGGKLPLQAGRIVFLGVCIAAPFVSSAGAWCVLFLGFGAAINVCGVSFSTVQLDMLPEQGRANRLAIVNASQVIVVLVASVIGGTTWKVAGETAFPWLATGGAVAVALSVALMVGVAEPRTVRRESEIQLTSRPC